MIWLLCGGVPLLVLIVKVFARDPKGWFVASFYTLVFMSLILMTTYGMQQLGWIGP